MKNTTLRDVGEATAKARSRALIAVGEATAKTRRREGRREEIHDQDKIRSRTSNAHRRFHCQWLQTPFFSSRLSSRLCVFAVAFFGHDATAWLAPLVLLILLCTSCDQRRSETRVGSKLDVESVTLGEIACQLIRQTGSAVAFRDRLGGTHVAWEALVAGELDVYPEYTGTLSHEILAASHVESEQDIRAALAGRGILMTRPLGFNNTYAIGMRETDASRLKIRNLSDLRSHPELHLGFSNEFISRTDGWAGLRDRYRLPQTGVRGMEHALSYPALTSGAIDATDLYSTDAEIRQLNLRVLADDLHYFPDYKAVYLYRADWAARFPAAAAALSRLEGRISEADMTAMNARVKIDHAPAADVAADYLNRTLGTIGGPIAQSSVTTQILERTREHLWLVGTSLLAAIALGLPFGVLSARFPTFGKVILSTVAVLYTIPGLALLVFLIPHLGTGSKPAIAALFLYSLLPIVRNTHAGLVGIAPALRESAAALGLPAATRLLRIELPLAAGSILAGIKTAAVINVGTATLGALVGAGGYGEPILSGITLGETKLMLRGAIPAAVMALAVQGLFELVERKLIPAALRRG